MKKIIVFLLLACLLVSAAGCSVLEAKEKVFSIEDYGLQLTADDTFNTVADSSNFDLYITDENVYIGVMAYKYVDLPESVTPADVYTLQNEDFFGKRTNVQKIEEEFTESISWGTKTQGLYSAERDGNKNYYATYLIDMPGEETVSWVLISSLPSYFISHSGELDAIASSLRPVK